ncbi:acyltransferase family protein [Ensifer soli]|uniref:acyltransferase family protein n=1 Tax=Ciceribacter sp. sgz301302 TaxID=3342379 RepID=UPI0035B72FAA
MRVFRGLDGARGLLATAVVLSHAVQLTGVANGAAIYPFFQAFGDVSVRVFIMLSGFVITHLLTERRERYGVYITRRFFRLYPVYLACLALGLVATGLFFHVLPTHPWGELLPISPRLSGQIESSAGLGYPAHLIAHLTMLHGVIPDTVFYGSEFLFLPPAWSLSLEWQFYLIAPFVLAALSTRLGAAALCLAALGAFMAYKTGVFGSFVLPSFLPGALHWFAVGIASRLFLPAIERRPRLFGVLALALTGALALARPAHLEFFLWALLFVHAIGALPVLTRALRPLLENPPVEALGARSYPLYLAHYPVIELLVAGAALAGLGYGTMAALTLAAAYPLSLALAGLLHHRLEKPGIAFGAQVAALLRDGRLGRRVAPRG